MVNKKRKVLIFSVAYHPFVGGAEIATQEITKRISEDFEFHLITLRIDNRLAPEEKVGNVFVYRIGWGRNGSLKSRISPALIISKYLFPFSACLKARTLNRKNNFEAIWSIMASYSGFAALFFKFLNPKVPFILTLQEGDPLEHIKKRVGVFMPLYKKIFSKADAIQTISKFLAVFAKKMGYRGDPVVIPNGVDMQNFSKDYTDEELDLGRKEIGKMEGNVMLITASRLVWKNGIDQIIKSLAYLPRNYKLFIAGDGEEKETLKNLAKKSKLEERVRFAGSISHEKLPLYLKASNIFIRPSRSEGLGNSFIEAMAAGVPVIGTSVGGIPDFIENGVTGLFCKVDDPEDIAKQVKRLIEDDKPPHLSSDCYDEAKMHKTMQGERCGGKLRETIVKNARENVQKSYDWDNISQRMKEEVFDKLSLK